MVKQVNMLIFGTILKILTVAFVLLGNKEESNHVNLSVFYFESKVISLTTLRSWTSAGWMGSSSRSLVCTAGCCSPLIIAILWRTTHATMMSHALSGVTLSCRHWNRDLSMPMAISTQALVLQWAALKRCWGPGSGSE